MWIDDLLAEEQEDQKPGDFVFLIVDKGFFDSVCPFDVDLLKKALGKYMFVMAFGQRYLKDTLKLSHVYLYDIPLFLDVESIRTTRARETDWFNRDLCGYLKKHMQKGNIGMEEKKPISARVGQGFWPLNEICYKHL